MKILCVIIFFAVLALSSNAHASPSSWGYKGKTGPANWGKINFPICSEGKTQSPVNITRTTPDNPSPITFNYTSTPIDVINNGHTVQFNNRSNSSMTVDDRQYDLLQFHFHSPSEDTVDGKAFAMQLHLVHKSAEGQLAVVGVFLEEGDKDGSGNKSLDTVFGALPGHAGLNLTGKDSFNVYDLLPPNKQNWHFMGSLTTPPCTEGVKWYVMKEPVKISSRQLTRFRSIFHGIARPVQPWNDR